MGKTEREKETFEGCRVESESNGERDREGKKAKDDTNGRRKTEVERVNCRTALALGLGFFWSLSSIHTDMQYYGHYHTLNWDMS